MAAYQRKPKRTAYEKRRNASRRKQENYTRKWMQKEKYIHRNEAGRYIYGVPVHFTAETDRIVRERMIANTMKRNRFATKFRAKQNSEFRMTDVGMLDGYEFGDHSGNQFDEDQDPNVKEEDKKPGMFNAVRRVVDEFV